MVSISARSNFQGLQSYSMSSRNGAWGDSLARSTKSNRASQGSAPDPSWRGTWEGAPHNAVMSEGNDIVITSELLRQLDLVPYPYSVDHDSTRHMCTPVHSLEDEGPEEDLYVSERCMCVSPAASASSQRRALPTVSYVEGGLTLSAQNRSAYSRKTNISRQVFT